MPVQTPSAIQTVWAEARRLFDELQHEQALPYLDRVIQALTAPGVSDPDLLASAYELRARSRFTLDDQPGAEADFTALLTVKPEYTLGPKVSPTIVKLFDALKRKLVGQARIMLTPPGDATIDGRPFTEQQLQGPVDLMAGDHVVAAARAGYRAQSQPFSITAGELVTVPVTLERTSATLAVLTIPDGVEVVLDGTPQGVTSRNELQVEGGGALIINELAPGRHTLLLRRDCFTPTERTVTITEPDDVRTGEIRLAPAVATVTIETTEPEATIYIDGRPRGPAPAEVNNVCEGPHVIEVRSPRGRFVDRRTWRAGDTATLRAELRPAFALMGSGAAAAPQNRAAIERALGGARGVLLYMPVDRELEDALKGENLAVDALAAEMAPRGQGRMSRDVRREAVRRLSGRLGVQGIAMVTSPEPNQLAVSMLASGSAEAETFRVSLADPPSLARAADLLSAPVPPLLRPALESSVVDALGVEGAAVIRAGGAGARAGLAAGDVIVGVGANPVASVADLRARLANAGPGAALDLQVKNPAGATRSVPVTPALAIATLPMRDPALLYNRLLLDLRDLVRSSKTPADQNAARLNLAIVHMRLANHEDAIAELQQVKLPEGPGVSAGTVAYLSALAHEAIGQVAEAQNALTRAAAAEEARLGDEGPLVAPLAQQKLKALRP